MPIHGVVDIATNPPKGGSVGTDFSVSENLVAVKQVTVWVDDGSGVYSDRKLIKAIKTEWTDGTSRSEGNQSGVSHSFQFDDSEKVTSLSLWTGDRVDRIQMKTSGSRTFDHGGKDYTNGRGGKENSQDIGEGTLLGFNGKYDSNELISLGTIFKEDSD
jgi:hypothetical protein